MLFDHEIFHPKILIFAGCDLELDHRLKLSSTNQSTQTINNNYETKDAQTLCNHSNSVEILQASQPNDKVATENKIPCRVGNGPVVRSPNELDL